MSEPTGPRSCGGPGVNPAARMDAASAVTPVTRTLCTTSTPSVTWTANRTPGLAASVRSSAARSAPAGTVSGKNVVWRGSSPSSASGEGPGFASQIRHQAGGSP